MDDRSPEPPKPAAEGVILVVDDVAVNRQVLSILLRKAGYQPLTAFSAEHALQQIAFRVPDLIMLDIRMPGTDGYALCRRLRAEPSTAKVPIIFLSALDEAGDKVKAFESGGADYVTKPFQAPEVLARVAHQLKIARLQRDLERDKAELLRMNELLVAAQRKTAMVFNSLSELLPGLVLDGKYRIEERIGSGGFGVVYRARHLGLERAVALKVFRPPVGAGGSDALSRFQLEGISACRVSHPNAVTVLDSAVSTQGIPYLVMELLDGHTLYFEIVRKRQLSVRRCLQIGIPLCDVLVAAHAAGIIHRDIKPENVMLHRGAGGEVVKVLDFGLAKLLGAEPPSVAPVVTGQNDLVGTPVYIAPERLEGKEYDGRTDVYSVGIMLYEMLAGQVPFADRNESFLKIIYNHLHAEPAPLRVHRSDLSAAMEAVVMRALTRNPLRRPTAQQLRDELLALAQVVEAAPQDSDPTLLGDDENTISSYVALSSRDASVLNQQWNHCDSNQQVELRARPVKK
jgi:serine/threonine protein kinase/CheY-like chemotaxis protein